MDPKLMIRNEILEAEGVVPDYEDGIRITDAKTLQIARVSFLLYSSAKLIE
jgi:acetylglutamate kinase